MRPSCRTPRGAEICEMSAGRGGDGTGTGAAGAGGGAIFAMREEKLFWAA